MGSASDEIWHLGFSRAKLIGSFAGIGGDGSTRRERKTWERFGPFSAAARVHFEPLNIPELRRSAGIPQQSALPLSDLVRTCSRKTEGSWMGGG